MDCNTRSYTVDCDGQVLLVNILIDGNAALESQLESITAELIQQNPRSTLTSSLQLPHGPFRWGFKEKDTWFKVVHVKDLLIHSTLGFFPASSRLLTLPSILETENNYLESNEDIGNKNNTSNGVNEHDSPKEVIELDMPSCPIEFFFVNPAHQLRLPYFFCDLMIRGGEMWALRDGIIAERLYIPPTSRCKYGWCNILLGKRIRPHEYAETFLVLRGLEQPVIAIYCSAKCAMCDRKETLAHTRRLTLKSFRFLSQQTPDDIRLLRLLREVHDELEKELREEAPLPGICR